MFKTQRVITAFEWRFASARAQFRSARILVGWKRERDYLRHLHVGERLPVIFCTWRRLDRLPHTLALLAAQDVPVQALIWNNSPRRGQVEAAAALASIPVSVHYSTRNIGGFGRFYLARAAARAGHDRVVFIDDDHDFGPDTIGRLLADYRPRTLSGWWAWRFRSDDYGDRDRATRDESAHYVGTCGMIADSAVFLGGRLFRCPRRFWFIEDLWLCYVASHLAGYGLRSSAAEFKAAEDEHDLYLTLGGAKQRFLRYLIRQGWNPNREKDELVGHSVGHGDEIAAMPQADSGG
jgi:Glycosyl transferase family 2